MSSTCHRGHLVWLQYLELCIGLHWMMLDFFPKEVLPWHSLVWWHYCCDPVPAVPTHYIQMWTTCQSWSQLQCAHLHRIWNSPATYKVFINYLYNWNHLFPGFGIKSCLFHDMHSNQPMISPPVSGCRKQDEKPLCTSQAKVIIIKQIVFTANLFQMFTIT